LKYIFINKKLIFSLVKKEFIIKYLGSRLGFLWSILNPIFLLVFYTFVFAYIFQIKWSSAYIIESKTHFAMMLYIGLITFNFFNEILLKSPNIIISNANYVKKIKIPSEIFCIVACLSSLISFFISFAVLLLFLLVFQYNFHYEIIYVIIILIPLFLFCYGLTLLVSSLSVFLKDIQHFLNFTPPLFLFSAPIFYSIDSVPSKYQFLLYFNPLTLVINDLRDVIFLGNAPNFFYLSIFTSISIIFIYGSHIIFSKLQRFFPDVV